MKYFLPLIVVLAFACNTSKKVQVVEKKETAEKIETEISEVKEEVTEVKEEIAEMKEEPTMVPKDNEELKQLHKEDQADRKTDEIDWDVVGKRDKARKARVFEMLDADLVKTGKDYYHAAMIFQHGGDTIASTMAVKMMKKAIELDPTTNKWLLAAAIDRDLMFREKPQIYGTQYTKDDNDKWILYDIDTTKVTEAERMEHKVPNLAQQQERVKMMNKKKLNTLLKEGMEIDNFIAFCKKEDLTESEYDMSEMRINMLGYELMGDEKNDAALKVFMLNTELYPDAYNTHDSLGECLLKMDKREEGIAAYKKSLELNPKNDNATKVLKEIEAE